MQSTRCVTYFLVAVYAAVCVLSPSSALAGVYPIRSIHVTPEHPTTTDVIRVSGSGRMPQSPVRVLRYEFARAGHDLDLAVHVQIGDQDSVGPWTFDTEIGRLPAGSYDLTVRAIEERGRLMGTAQLEFTVVPEPAASGPILVGAWLLTSRRQRRRCVGS